MDREGIDITTSAAPEGVILESVDPLILLIIVALVGMLSQLARSWSEDEAKGQSRTASHFLGGLLGSAIASFSLGAIMVAQGVNIFFVLGAAGPAGWVGASLLGTIAERIEKYSNFGGDDK